MGVKETYKLHTETGMGTELRSRANGHPRLFFTDPLLTLKMSR